MKTEFIVANWKMNGSTDFVTKYVVLTELLSEVSLKNKEVILCPPAIFIQQLSSKIKNPNIKIGLQDCHHQHSGAFTGDISAEMGKDCGCTYAIVGHSERRQHHNESEELVFLKARSAAAAKLTPILCVGENLNDRENDNTVDILRKQLSPLKNWNITNKLIVAYEPVWAIGTGLVPKDDQIVQAHSFIGSFLSEIGHENIAIIYGGSVTAQNSKHILSLPNVRGCLVGGASLKADQFAEICKSSESRA